MHSNVRAGCRYASPLLRNVSHRKRERLRPLPFSVGNGACGGSGAAAWSATRTPGSATVPAPACSESRDGPTAIPREGCGNSAGFRAGARGADPYYSPLESDVRIHINVASRGDATGSADQHRIETSPVAVRADDRCRHRFARALSTYLKSSRAPSPSSNDGRARRRATTRSKARQCTLTPASACDKCPRNAADSHSCSAAPCGIAIRSCTGWSPWGTVISNRQPPPEARNRLTRSQMESVSLRIADQQIPHTDRDPLLSAVVR